MKIKQLLIIVIISSILLSLYGLYNVYNIFYPNYFDITHYEQNAWPIGTKPPTKMETFLWGFSDIGTVGIAFLSSTVLYFSLNTLRKKDSTKNEIAKRG